MKLDWRQAILYGTAIGMEGCWLYALIDLLNKKVTEGGLSTLGLLLLYPSAFAFNKLLRRLQWHRFILRGISWLFWLAGMLLITKIQLFADLPLSDGTWLLAVPRAIAEVIYGFKPELLILISTAVLWGLGRRMAHIKFNFNALVSEFQFGLVILLITFLLVSQLGVDLVHPVYLALLFFLFALLGISIAHALEGTSWLSGLYQGHWAGLLLISISLILIVGLLISLLVTPDLLQLFLTAIKWVWGLIVKGIAFIASLFPEPSPAPVEPIPNEPLPMPPSEPDWSEFLTMPESVRSGLRLSWTVMVSGFLLFALWRISSDIFGWLRRKLASMAGAEFEPLPGAFGADILGVLKRVFGWLLGLRLPFRLGTRARSSSLEINSVRQIYRQLLRWAATGGYPRRPSQTPHEYSYRLAGLLPAAQGDLDLITQQYVTTRYGASLPTEDELNQINQSWHRVRQNHLKKKSPEPANE